MGGDLLRIYMNDQLALGIGWRELARRAQRNNRGTELGKVLDVVAGAIAEDVSMFETMMDRLALPRSQLKGLIAVAGERLARLKLNGQLVGYSPLSRFLELDVLTMGINDKKQLWATLRDLAGLHERLPDMDFDRLIERAEEQRIRLEPFRQDAGRRAFRG
jgi:hypothetical protein